MERKRGREVKTKGLGVGSEMEGATEKDRGTGKEARQPWRKRSEALCFVVL